MSETVVKREVTINNKYKKIYKEYPGYQELNEADQEFFDSIFPVLWMNEVLELSNCEIGDKFCYSKSTIQKKLKRCEAAQLIIRDQITTHDDATGRFSSSRKLYLDPWFKAWFSKQLGLKPVGMVSDSSEAVEDEESTTIVVEEIQSIKKPEKIKPVIKKFRR